MTLINSASRKPPGYPQKAPALNSIKFNIAGGGESNSSPTNKPPGAMQAVIMNNKPIVKKFAGTDDT